MGNLDRALGIKPFFLSDLWGRGGVLVRLKQAAKNLDDVGDDLNCIISLAFSANVMPSKLALSNLKLYLSNRPKNFGTLEMNEKDPVMGALSWYFRKESGGNPKLAEIWRPIIDYYRSVLNCPV